MMFYSTHLFHHDHTGNIRICSSFFHRSIFTLDWQCDYFPTLYSQLQSGYVDTKVSGLLFNGGQRAKAPFSFFSFGLKIYLLFFVTKVFFFLHIRSISEFQLTQMCEIFVQIQISIFGNFITNLLRPKINGPNIDKEWQD